MPRPCSGLLREAIGDNEIHKLVAIQADGTRIELEGPIGFEVWVK